ncbi:MAG: ECF transporter S component [Lachnospiraceae bacterium]|nr:ECF transporter S component [Lachnospiraceae bacterium]
MFTEGFWDAAAKSGGFLLVCLGVFAGIFIIARTAQALIDRKYPDHNEIKGTRRVVMIGMLSAVAFVLMIFEIPLPFAPSFYKIDLSEVPVMVGTFSMGPGAGVLIEFFKILLKLVFRGTTTVFVGELANFAVGCSYLLPAGIIYYYRRTKKSALLALTAGTVSMTVFGSLFNAVYLLPRFAELYGLPLEQIVAMGTEINGNVNSVMTLVLFCIVPFNLLKGVLVLILTMLIYKRISTVLKGRR